MNTRQSNVTRAFKVVVPLDAQKVEGFSPDQPVKVVARGAGGRLTSAKASFDRSGKGSATLTFKGHPGALRLWVGPGDADDDEMVGLQTLVQDIPSRLLATPEVVLPSIRIPAYWWAWWRLWCRTFTVRGRVVCPDGSPVPGAVVCAFDVDRWLFWTSRQQVGCATTDIDGTFSLTFRWCCGWWPWWWLRYRFWTREPLLVDRFQDLLGRIPELEPGPIPPFRPSRPSPPRWRTRGYASPPGGCAPSRWTRWEGTWRPPQPLRDTSSPARRLRDRGCPTPPPPSPAS